MPFSVSVCDNPLIGPKKRKCRFGNEKTDSLTQSQGADAPSPEGRSGNAGFVDGVAGQDSDARLQWLSPYSLHHVIAWARDAYLARRYEDVAEKLESLDSALDSYRESQAWALLSADWAGTISQQADEVDSLLNRLHANRDYFGNPAGWVPMLSLEVQAGLYDVEVKRALDLLYVVESVSRAADNVTKRREALVAAEQSIRDAGREALKEIKNHTDELENLTQRAADIKAREGYFQQSLQEIERSLEERAAQNVKDRHKVPDWKKGLRILASVAKVIPAPPPWQPALAGAGAALDLVANIDTKKPIDEQLITLVPDAVDSFNGSKAAIVKSAADWKNSVSWLENDLEFERLKENKHFREAEKHAKTALGPIHEVAKAIRDNSAPTRVSKSEIDQELDRLKAKDKLFGPYVTELEQLIADRAAVAERIGSILTNMESLTLEVRRSALAFDTIQASLLQASASPSVDLMLTIQQLRQRAEQRLKKYNYMLIKAYEHRLVKRFEGQVDIKRVYEEIGKLLELDKGARLEPEDIATLKSVFDSQLSALADGIVSEYDTNHAGLTDVAEFWLREDEIAALNQRKPVKINVVTREPREIDSRYEQLVLRKINVLKAEFERASTLARIDPPLLVRIDPPLT